MTEQDNIPEGYFRDTNGMLKQIQQAANAESTAIDLPANLAAMDREGLLALVQRVYAAGWGNGELTGRKLVESALMSDDAAYDALLLRGQTLALNAKDWKEFHTLASWWSERKRGKPLQSIDLNQKIGIVQIVLEASKQRKTLDTTNGMPSSPVIEHQPIDK